MASFFTPSSTLLIVHGVIEVKHLRLLDAIVRHGSMSGAARELGYSQSAVTQQIQSLERHLGTALAVRNRRGVHLTEAGEVLVRHGRGVLAQMTLAKAEVEAVAGLRSGKVRIACFPSAAATILPQALGTLGQEVPGLSFTLVEAEPPRSLEILRSGECDIAIIYDYVAAGHADAEGQALHADEVSTALIDEGVYVVVPPNHPAADRRWVELRDLKDSRWIAGCPECRGNLLQSCATAGFLPDIAFETDDYAALQALAAAGLGVALVPELMLTARNEPDLLLKRLSPLSMRCVSAVSTESLQRVPGVMRTIEALSRAAETIERPTVR